jgi:hypothetical protein
MAEVQRHVQECIECRTQLAKYELVSRSFDAYCFAAMAAKLPRLRSRWVSLLPAAAAVALVATLAWALLRPRVQPLVPASRPAVISAGPAIVPETAPAERKTTHRRRAPSPVPVQKPQWQPPEPAIQIAIPADAMFPPGAVPDGVNFTADVSFAPDGSTQQIRLRPRLVQFERRAN